MIFQHDFVAHLVATLVWLALALFGFYIQERALSYSRRNFKVAKPFGDDSHILIMAHARLRTNYVRMSAVAVNFFVGVLALMSLLTNAIGSTPPMTVLSWIISVAFILNEFALLGIATLEVRGHRSLVRSMIRIQKMDAKR